MKHYEFKVTLSGYGKTKEEAWTDATDSFAQDPGSPDDEDSKSVEVCPKCLSEDVQANVRQGEGQAFGGPAHIVDMGFKCECGAEWGFEQFKKEEDADAT